MDTSRLKKFAPQARKTLIEIVTVRLNYLLDNEESLEMEEHREAIKTLKADIAKEGKDQLIDRVAYTWFNRFMALRYMDVNDYQPLNLRVISPVDNATVPQILAEALQGNIADELKVDKRAINEILNGQTESNNPREEVFKMLLIASCNHLHSLFPFLFEKINDYTELLLPNDLLSDLSILTDFRNGMTAQDCKEVEVLGWLYQFYISELNADLIKSKKAYKKDELAPASQLFTPKWIVQYMVDNTLGQVWAEMKPGTKILSDLQYYITPDYKDTVSRTQKPIEEIKFFEPCVGSGHILAYAFDVFYKMYEEAGYNASEIPALIIKNNLYGVDIDQRATQIASFTLLMKGREKHRRFLRKAEQDKLIPNVYHYEDFEEDSKFKNATALGSLIKVTKEEADAIIVDPTSLFVEKQRKLKDLYNLLSRKYDVVVTNPPYISSSRMENSLKTYVNDNYIETKSDLFACFILRCLELTNENGLTGNMTPFVWMFISSYEKLRKTIIDEHFINNLIQLEYSGFDGATVPICTFTLRNKPMDAKGSYIRLSDFKGSQNQAPKTLEAIQNPKCGWFYVKNQKDFKKIPGNNIGYWLSENGIENFTKNNIVDFAHSFQGLISGNNNRLMRYWVELPNDLRTLSFHNYSEAKGVKTWVPYQKGGAYRKWFGNNDYFLYWNGSGDNLTRSRTENRNYYFKDCISWTFLSSSKFGARRVFNGHLWDVAGSSAFSYESKNTNALLGLLCTSVGRFYLDILNPTLNYQVENILALPVIESIFLSTINKSVDICISISHQEWDSRETSWDFKQNELIRLKGQDLEEAVDLYKIYWTKKFIELHQNEEELNRQFIEIYGLEEDLDPNVPLEDITILREELDQKKLKEISVSWQSGWELKEGKWLLENQKNYPELPFDEKELIKQFISYAVGCMFGRYSLDKEGLILANQGETVEDYWRIVTSGDTADTGKSTELSEQRETKFTDGGANRSEQNDNNLNEKTKNSELTTHNSSLSNHSPFTPDEDNIIPVLDAEWFEDDIVTHFRKFVAAVWGNDVLEENIRFIEDKLGMNLRRYFLRGFYADHIKRYKKRPIYWQFSSPSGAFNVLIYMHRYDRDTLNRILANYLRVFIDKLENNIGNLENLAVNGSQREQTQAKKDIDATHKTITELKTYAHDVFLPLATERINIDLDDGVLVNYNKFGKAIKQVSGLNDAKTKKKVKGFDWIDTSEIR